MKLVIAGDYCPRYRIKQKIEENDFSFLAEVKDVLSHSDYNIVNFECPVTKPGNKPIAKTGPNLCCHENALDALSSVGFNCVTLANNHFRDYGQEGVEDTVKACDDRGIEHCGGGIDLQVAKKILYKTINGERLAIINVCENEWSIATDIRGGSAPVDIIDTSKTIKEARNNADYVIMIIHGGVEFYNLPTPRMKKSYRFFIDCGADAIINHHQHCFSGYETYQGKPIIYGLGNFCFDKQNASTSWCKGYMVRLNLEKNGVFFGAIPYEQCTKDKAEVSLLKDKDAFLKEIETLNSIIGNDRELKGKFDELCSDGKKRFAPVLMPYQNKFLRLLAIRGYLPSFMTKYRMKYLRAVTTCESYHECLMNYLNQYL